MKTRVNIEEGPAGLRETLTILWMKVRIFVWAIAVFALWRYLL